MKVHHVWHILAIALGMALIGGAVPLLAIAAISGTYQNLNVATVMIVFGLPIALGSFLQLLAEARTQERLANELKAHNYRYKVTDE
jgi:hypothetical protein